MRKTSSGVIAPQLGKALITLGRAQAALLQFPAAEMSLIEAQEILSKAPGQASGDRRACMQELVKLYTNWEASEPKHGHAANAAEWQHAQDALTQIRR